MLFGITLIFFSVINLSFTVAQKIYVSVSYLEDNYRNPNLLSSSTVIFIMSNICIPQALNKIIIKLYFQDV